jgi:dienelactone hydrolase
VHTSISTILFFIVLSTLSFSKALAESSDYQFNPEDPHHALYIPDNQTHAPAILMLHASTGIENVNHDWARRLREQGYVVYIIDSFTPRGWEDRRSVGWETATQAQLNDLVPAYEYLSHLPFVDPENIGLLGFSMGGFDVLKVMTESNNPKNYQQLNFKVAASFYGVCHRLDNNTILKANTKLFIGENDDRATTQDCVQLIHNSSEVNPNIDIQIYSHALHGFDNFEFPESKEIIDEKGEHYHIGFDAAARAEALKDLPDYFDRALKPAQ